jgi:prephenate dehydratase
MAAAKKFPPVARIAYLGPPGTFSEEALLSEPDLAVCERVALPTITDAIKAVADHAVDAAFVPIENSIEGSVNQTLDELIFGEDLFIQREVVLEVHLDLLGLASATIEGAKRVLSFPHALGQCRVFIARHLGGVEIVATNSTADAARLVSESRDADALAVAPALAAKLYGLNVLAHAIEDHGENRTRFVLLAPKVVPHPTGHDRTAIVCFQQANHPGSLHEILGQFAARSLNLTRIESRPTKQALGEYCFVIEVEGHIADEVLGDCLRELQADLESVKFLGSYPVFGVEASELREELSEHRKSAAQWLSSLRSRISSDT